MVSSDSNASDKRAETYQPFMQGLSALGQCIFELLPWLGVDLNQNKVTAVKALHSCRNMLVKVRV